MRSLASPISPSVADAHSTWTRRRTTLLHPLLLHAAALLLWQLGPAVALPWILVSRCQPAIRSSPTLFSRSAAAVHSFVSFALLQRSIPGRQPINRPRAPNTHRTSWTPASATATPLPPFPLLVHSHGQPIARRRQQRPAVPSRRRWRPLRCGGLARPWPCSPRRRASRRRPGRCHARRMAGAWRSACTLTER